MTAERFFCALRSLENGEAIYATVARIDTWLLLEYPLAWRKDAIEQSQLPERLKHKLAGLRRTNRLHRQVLIRQCYKPRASMHCLFVRSSERDPVLSMAQFSTYEEFANVDLQQKLMDGGARVEGQAVYAVCTHGTHDKCCAKFGLQTYRAALREGGDRVWQCSHIGGDRFAANIVVLPYGLYYGRVNPDDAAALIDYTDRGEILLSHYRGRCCYPRVVQAAEYFIRRESGLAGIRDLYYLERQAVDPNSWIVRFRSVSVPRVHEVQLKFLPDALVERLTCGSDRPSSVAQYELLQYSNFPGLPHTRVV